jgi:hypothetical protein
MLTSRCTQMQGFSYCLQTFSRPCRPNLTKPFGKTSEQIYVLSTWDKVMLQYIGDYDQTGAPSQREVRR